MHNSAMVDYHVLSIDIFLCNFSRQTITKDPFTRHFNDHEMLCERSLKVLKVDPLFYARNLKPSPITYYVAFFPENDFPIRRCLVVYEVGTLSLHLLPQSTINILQ